MMFVPLLNMAAKPLTSSFGIFRSFLGGCGGPTTLPSPTMIFSPPSPKNLATPPTTRTGIRGASGLGLNAGRSPVKDRGGRSPRGSKMVDKFAAGRPGKARELANGRVGSDVRAAGETELVSKGRRANVAACATFDSIPSAANANNRVFFMDPLQARQRLTNVNLRIDHIMYTCKRSMEFLSVSQQKMPKSGTAHQLRR